MFLATEVGPFDASWSATLALGKLLPNRASSSSPIPRLHGHTRFSPALVRSPSLSPARWQKPGCRVASTSGEVDHCRQRRRGGGSGPHILGAAVALAWVASDVGLACGAEVGEEDRVTEDDGRERKARQRRPRALGSVAVRTADDLWGIRTAGPASPSRHPHDLISSKAGRDTQMARRDRRECFQ